MEPGVRKYLIRILNTLSVGLLWMVLNTTLGIKYDFAFVNDHITKGNVLFYIWFILSFIAFTWWVIRLWSKPIDYEE